MTRASGSRPTRRFTLKRRLPRIRPFQRMERFGAHGQILEQQPQHGEKPVKPSFLIEVMALQCLYGGWGGSFDREMQGFFATLADRIFDEWPDPAGLGPAISNGMDSARKTRARDLLRAAEREATLAIDHVRRGRNGEALRAWRELFGPKFPLS